MEALGGCVLGKSQEKRSNTTKGIFNCVETSGLICHEEPEKGFSGTCWALLKYNWPIGIVYIKGVRLMF